MPRIISPPRSEFHKLRQPLQPGEMLVFEFFDRCLAEEWEIYVQPHLNGLRPDFVLLHPHVGIAVFEVKDWDLDAMERWVEEREGRPPRLMGSRNGRDFSLQDDNPVEKVRLYEQEILDLYCPRLDARAGPALITAGVCFPFADDERVADLFSLSREHRGMDTNPRYYPLSGRRALAAGDLRSVFPEAYLRRDSYYMTPQLAADLRAWLVEPDASASQRMPLELDDDQRKLVKGRTEKGYRRIEGPAGSGKSVVLAARAAELVAEGKDVLVISYNITLLNYLADLAVRHRPGARKGATWLNFHAWCKRVCLQADQEAEYRALWRPELRDGVGPDDPPSAALCALVRGILTSDTAGRIPRYDAILVDEGQDMDPEWWAVLRLAHREGAEMLLTADRTQDIYGTASAWTDGVMHGAGFSGGWARLPISYRLPPTLIDHAREFARRLLPAGAELPAPEQGELDIYPCRLRWVQTAPEDAGAVTDREVRALMSAPHGSGVSVSDVTVLVGSQAAGAEVVGSLEARGIRCIHTFGAGDEGRKKKLAFFMGDARVKVTTVHSFKGWEARAIVVRMDHARDERDRALLYTALTRVRRHTAGSFLTVVCADETLAGYGRTWPEFVRARAAAPV